LSSCTTASSAYSPTSSWWDHLTHALILTFVTQFGLDDTMLNLVFDTMGAIVEGWLDGRTT